MKVDAAIDVVDMQKGIRGIKDNGKSAQSRFKFLCFDEKSDTSIISCYPVTG